MQTELAPIVLFVYNRPDHTLETLEALSANDLASMSTLYVYSDGPKVGANAAEIETINEVRNIVRSKNWCKEVHLIEQPINKGLANSIVHGVTEVVNRHEKVIVLEDDIVPQKGFLKYMNDALNIYAHDDSVMHISAYVYPMDIKPVQETFFLKILSCWGWATWSRAWKYYNHNVDDHLSYFSSAESIKRFNINGHADFFRHLQLNKSKRIYSWAVRWYASWLRQDGLTLFSAKSLVQNIGFDGTGVHYSEPNYVFKTEVAESIGVKRQDIVENQELRNSIDRFYKNRPDVARPKGTKAFLQRMTTIIPPLGRVSGILGRLKLIWRFRYDLYQSSLSNSSVSDKAKLYLPHTISDTEIGDYTYVSKNAMISKTTIGKFCSIGPNFICGWGIHPTNGISTAPMFYSNHMQNGMTLSAYNKAVERRPIKIGNDVFIGMNVSILDGVTIGDGAVIGAGSVVAKDVPPYAVVGGVPAQIIKFRFDEKIINDLMAIKWWDFSDEKLSEVEQYFSDIDTFIKKNLTA